MTVLEIQRNTTTSTWETMNSSFAPLLFSGGCAMDSQWLRKLFYTETGSVR